MSELVMTHDFAAPPARVYDAFIDNELTRSSYLAAGSSSCEVERDVRPGGKWRIAAPRGGMDFVALGEYLETDRPHRLVHTFAMPQFSPNVDTITIVFAEAPGGCRVTYTHAGPDIASELAALAPGEKSGSEQGWRMMFAAIDAHVRAAP